MSQLDELKKDREQLHDEYDAAEQEIESARAELKNCEPKAAPKIRDRIEIAEARRREVARRADANLEALEPLEAEAKKEELAVWARKADPAPVRARIAAIAAEIIEHERRIVALNAEAENTILVHRNQHTQMLAVARRTKLPAPEFHPVPFGQLRLARLLVEPPQDSIQLARDMVSEISPGSTLPVDLAPTEVVRLFVEQGPEAVLSELRARDRERAKRETEARDRLVGGGRAMADRINELVAASRARRLLDAEQRELDQLQQWAGMADGVSLFLAAQQVSAAPTQRALTVEELEAMPRTVRGVPATTPAMVEPSTP